MQRSLRRRAKRGRGVWTWLITLFFVAMLAAQVWLAPRPPCAGSNCPPPSYNIIQLELARTPARACQILAQWGRTDGVRVEQSAECVAPPAVVKKVRLGLMFDYGFALSYVLIGIAVLGWARRRLPRGANKSNSLARIGQWMMLLAGVSDAVENHALDSFLRDPQAAVMLERASQFAMLKFTLIGVVILLLIGLLMIGQRQQPRFPSI